MKSFFCPSSGQFIMESVSTGDWRYIQRVVDTCQLMIRMLGKKENIGVFLRPHLGPHHSVQVRISLFVESHSKLLGKQTDSTEFSRDGDFVSWGFPQYLPMNIEDLRAEGLIEDGMLKFVVVVELEESVFTWDDVFKRKQAEASESLRQCQSRMFSHLVTENTSSVGEKHRIKHHRKKNSSSKRIAIPYWKISAAYWPIIAAPLGIRNLHPVTPMILKPRPPSDPLVDFSVVTEDGRRIWCHKAVLAMKSCYFFNLIFSEMRESAEDMVEFDYIDSEAFMEILHYIYTDKTSDHFMDLDLFDMLDAANRFRLEGLKVICEQRLVDLLETRNVLEMLVLSDRYDLKVLKECALNLASDDVMKVRKLDGAKELREHLWNQIFLTVAKRMRAQKHLPSLPLF